jgi:hypothetical protein
LSGRNVVNPEDLASDRWKEIRQARERIAKVEAVRAESLARLEELRGRIGPAERRDREALGAALLDGKAEPASEAAKLKAELGQAERNDEALLQAATDAHGQIGRLVRSNRETWRSQTLRARGKAKSRFERAIAELEAAREALNNEATLLNWLSSGDVGEAAMDALGGRRGSDPDGRPVLAFSRTLEELRRDCEYLASFDSSQREQPVRLALERMQRV